MGKSSIVRSVALPLMCMRNCSDKINSLYLAAAVSERKLCIFPLRVGIVFLQSFFESPSSMLLFRSVYLLTEEKITFCFSFVQNYAKQLPNINMQQQML